MLKPLVFAQIIPSLSIYNYIDICTKVLYIMYDPNKDNTNNS